MAGSTTNIGLKKPTYSEDADVAIINENMDTLDSTISALDNGLAIVSNNNTHGAITAGQYVYVRNHGSLAEGMYTANSNIAANATLSSSNLTAVSSGSLNKLNSDLGTLNGKLMCSGYMEWNDITLSSGSWATHTGNVSSGVKPSGNAQDGSYNLSLDIAGTYLVIYHAEIEDSSNKTGVRGIRQYVTETNINEFFFAPSGNNTTCEASCIVHSNGSDNVRMGVYQSSGDSLTVKNIRVMAVMLQRD